MTSDLNQANDDINSIQNESESIFKKLYDNSRSDKKVSLINIKEALDYLIVKNDPCTITYRDITDFISSSLGHDGKRKTPKCHEQIKNDKNGMKKYADQRILEAKGVNKKPRKTYSTTRSKVDELLEVDKEILVDRLRLAEQLNVGYMRKIRQHEVISNKTKIVIGNIKPIDRFVSRNMDISTTDSFDTNNIKLSNSEKDLLFDFYSMISEKNNGIKFSIDGIFYNSDKVGDFDTIEAIAKSIGMTHKKFIDVVGS
ncbi:hypothetical protein [Methylobacter tundripaludum]|uniref:hypothetical protein n=1 Tax=Methylobacter tundripaludum TaxID=173365 RepID=UPI0004DEED6C|nr:hypothetical protein [Methylobacter tundripaludum]